MGSDNSSEDRNRARRVAWLIADGGWQNALPEERDIAALLAIDEEVPDGDIHVRLEDSRYCLSTRTAELRIAQPFVRVWCPETGEALWSTAVQAKPAEEPEQPARPYVASRRSGLASAS